MLPDVRTAAAVAHEIVADRERQIARGRLMSELPEIPGRGLVLRRRVACCLGRRMIGAGIRLLRYGGQEGEGMRWAAHAN